MAALPGRLPAQTILRQFRDDVLVSRHQDTDVEAALTKRRRKPGGHFAKASGFREAGNFTGDEKHFDSWHQGSDLQNRFGSLINCARCALKHGRLKALDRFRGASLYGDWG